MTWWQRQHLIRLTALPHPAPWFDFRNELIQIRRIFEHVWKLQPSRKPPKILKLTLLPSPKNMRINPLKILLTNILLQRPRLVLIPRRPIRSRYSFQASSNTLVSHLCPFGYWFVCSHLCPTIMTKPSSVSTLHYHTERRRRLVGRRNESMKER
jgi:hypothetical protein